MNEFEKQLASRPPKSVPAEWRAQILKEARAASGAPVPSAFPLSWLRELLWPNPQAWGALAAIWIVMAAFQFMTPGTAPAGGGAVAKIPVPSFTEQRRELARLLDAASGKKDRPPADRPRGARPVDYTFV
jgi:hypothetical protein